MDGYVRARCPGPALAQRVCVHVLHEHLFALFDCVLLTVNAPGSSRCLDMYYRIDFDTVVVDPLLAGRAGGVGILYVSGRQPLFFVMPPWAELSASAGSGFFFFGLAFHA